MVKPSKTFGKSQKQQIAMATTMKKKRKPGEAALKEIKKQQKSTRKSIPKQSFKNLVMSITSEVLAERSAPGKRNTKNSSRNTPIASTSKSPATKPKVKKESVTKIKKESTTKIKKESATKIKKEKKTKK